MNFEALNDRSPLNGRPFVPGSARLMIEEDLTPYEADVSGKFKTWRTTATAPLTIYDQDRLFSYNIRCNEALVAIENFIAGINLRPPPIRVLTIEDDIKMFNSFLSKEFSRLIIDEALALAEDFPSAIVRRLRMADAFIMDADEAVLATFSSIKKKVLASLISFDDSFIIRKLKILTETLSLTDANRRKTTIVSADAMIDLTFDQFIKVVRVGGKIYANITSEGIILSDATASWVYRHKEFIDTLAVGDAIGNKSRTLLQLISELPALTDSLAKLFASRVFLSIQSEGITAIDSTNAVKYAYRRLDEPLTLADAKTNVVWAVRVPSETLSLVDSTGQARILPRALAETLALTDSTIAYALRQKILTEALALLDPLTRQQLQARVATDLATLSDQELQYLTRYKVASEATVLNDSTITALAKLRAFTESVIVQDGTITAKISKKIFAEMLGISEELVPNDIPYVTLVVRNTLGADSPSVLGMDTTAVLGYQPIDRID